MCPDEGSVTQCIVKLYISAQNLTHFTLELLNHMAYESIFPTILNFVKDILLEIHKILTKSSGKIKKKNA